MKLLLILSCCMMSLTAECKEYIINVEQFFKNDKNATQITSYFTDIYQSINITPQFSYYPTMRGLKLVNDGVVDAEAFRLDVVGKGFEHFVKLNEPIAHLQAGFFCVQKESCVIDKTDVIGVFSGFRGARVFCLEANLDCHYVENLTSLVKKLDTGLLDAILATEVVAEKIICLSSFETFYFLPNRASELPLYHYINRKHVNLKERLEEAIFKARKDGKVAIDYSNQKLNTLSCQKSVEFIKINET